MQEARIGDLLVVEGAGAYCSTMAAAGYNSALQVRVVPSPQGGKGACRHRITCSCALIAGGLLLVSDAHVVRAHHGPHARAQAHHARSTSRGSLFLVPRKLCQRWSLSRIMWVIARKGRGWDNQHDEGMSWRERRGVGNAPPPPVYVCTNCHV